MKVRVDGWKSSASIARSDVDENFEDLVADLFAAADELGSDDHRSGQNPEASISAELLSFQVQTAAWRA